MKTIVTNGMICLKGQFNIEYKICRIEYLINEDETFEYKFYPNYKIISLLNADIFQGIPGINLDLKKDVYIRKNIIPTFISERVPSPNRENYYELLEAVNMEYMNPIIYLIKTPQKYSGDSFYVTEYEKPKKVYINKLAKKCNLFGAIKLILDNIAANNDIFLDKTTMINTTDVFKILYFLYDKSLNKLKSAQAIGIQKAKQSGKYRGRKPIEVEKLLFNEILERVNQNEITNKEAASILGISIDKYYRLKNIAKLK